ncbi:MAG: OsmC family protein [Candidatus Omnitrophota bacterium]
MQVEVDYLGGMKFSADCAKHKVIIDQPLGAGGRDEGATPPQLFLSSLASCVGVYVVSYCKQTGIECQGMQIKIKAEKVSGPDRLDDIKIEVSLPNAELGQRHDAVIAVAKKCLIHNTIKHNPKIDVILM